MAKQRSNGPRIYGPYEHGSGWRVHVVTRRGGKRTTVYKSFATRGEADAFITGARDEAQGVTVSNAVRDFLESKRAKKRAPSTIASAEDRLALILGSVMARPVRYVVGRGEELYAASQVYPDGHRRGGQRRADDTHQNALAVAKDWGAWCVRRKLLKVDPFASVEPVGRRTRGADKARLTVDESRKLDAWCRSHASDQGAVLTLGYLLLGARASELVRRDVRDLDDDGRLLWIGETKTAAGRRRLEIPPVLGAMLIDLARDRAPDAPLFVSEASKRWAAGRRWSRFVARAEVLRCCRAADVPALPPQALRRTQATLATDAGATGPMVARHLGHESAVITHQAYIGRDAAKDAQVERSLRVINGGRR